MAAPNIFSTLQFLEQNGFLETKHKLEAESGVFLDMVYVGNCTREGNWDALEPYLRGFPISTKTMLLIKRQKFMEALYQNNHTAAVKILREDAELLSTCDSYKKLPSLLISDDWKAMEDFSWYRNTESARERTAVELRKLIEGDPNLREKLHFPMINNSEGIINRRYVHGQPSGSGQPTVPYTPGNDDSEDNVQTTEVDSLMIPGPLAVQVCCIKYTNTGDGLCALSDDSGNKFWKWTDKATVSSFPTQWLPTNCGSLMFHKKGDLSGNKCFAFSNDDRILASSENKYLSLFNLEIDEKKTIPIPARATVMDFDPWDSSTLVIGTDNGSILIFNSHEVKCTLSGHTERVTGLAISKPSALIVSSDPNQLFSWCAKTRKVRAVKAIEITPGLGKRPASQTRVQFFPDGLRLLLVMDTQLAVYDASSLEKIKQWIPKRSSAGITDAALSCYDVYAAFDDGSVGVFSSLDLIMKSQIQAASYLPLRLGPSHPYPTAIAACPSNAYQFALGLNNGEVFLVELPHK